MRILGIILASVLVVTGVVVQKPEAAQADEAQSLVKEATTSPAAPTSVSLSIKDDTSDASKSVITASFDTSLENSSSTATLYKIGNTNPIATVDTGKEASFTVQKPATKYEQYKVVVNNIESESIMVPSVSNTWEVSLSIDKPIYGTTDSLPKIHWKTNIPFNEATGKSLFIANSTNSSYVLAVISETDALEGDYQLENLYETNQKYVAYVAPSTTDNYNISAVTTYSEAVTNTVSTKWQPWTISLSIDKDSFSTNDGTPELTWETNQPLVSGRRFYVKIYDVTGGVPNLKQAYAFTTAFTGQSGKIKIPDFTTGTGHTYQAAVVTQNGDYEPIRTIEAQSNTVSTERSSWTVSLANNKTVYTTDDTPTLTWKTNQKTNYSYGVYIFDETDPINPVISTRAYYDGTDTNTSTLRFAYNQKPVSYRAYVATLSGSNQVTTPSDLKDVQAVSNLVSYERAPWTLSIERNSPTFAVDQDPSITWTTNQTTSTYRNDYYYSDDYALYVWDETAQKFAASMQYGTFAKTGKISLERFQEGDGHTYRAYLASKLNQNDFNLPSSPDGLKDVQAVSGTTSISRTPWALTLKPRGDAYYNYRYDDKGYGTLYSISYPMFLNSNQFTSYSRSYGMFFADEVTGELKMFHEPWSYTTSEMAVSGDAVVGKPAAFRGYIAQRTAADGTEPTRVEQLRDIQAVSNMYVPGIENGPEGSELIAGQNPSEANCNQQCHGDPINSATGEFYENNEDLSVSSMLPFDFNRSYSTSRASIDEGMGYGWSNNFSMNIKGVDINDLTKAHTVTVTQENSSTTNFYKSDNTHFITDNRVLADLTYDAQKKQFTLERKTGYRVIFSAATGKLIAVQDRNDNALNFQYKDDKLDKIVSSDGKSMQVTWDDNHIVSVTNNVGQYVNYTYDDDNNLTEVQTTEIALPKKYSYTAKHLVKTLTTADGGKTTNEYDSTNRVVTQTDPAGQDLTFSYSGYTTTITNPNGSVTKEEYNNRGQLAVQTLGYGSDKQYIVEYHYDSNGQNDWQRANGDEITSYNYDQNGNMLSAVDPYGNITKYTYNEYNQLLTTTNPAGQTSTNKYNAKGNLVETKTYGGDVTKYDVNANGSIAAVQAPNQVAAGANKKTVLQYDANNYLSTTVSPEGIPSTTTNNAAGLATQAVDPDGNITKYFYDERFRPIKTEYPNGAVESVKYNESGQVVLATDVRGNQTTYTYDLFGNVSTQTDPRGTSRFIYDEMNQLISSTDFVDRTTTYEYDILGNVISTTDADGYQSFASYDNKGQITSSTNAQGVTTEYKYDVLGHVIKQINPDGTYVTNEYNNLGQLLNTTDQMNSKVQYKYDLDGNVVTVINPDGTKTATEYDANQNVISSIDEANNATHQAYDADNRITESADKSGEITKYAYNNVGLLATKTNANNSTVKYNYTSMGQIKQVSYDNWNSVDSEYNYNKVGDVTSIVKEGNTVKYSYDEIGNLTYRGPPSGEHGVKYSYDDAQNVKSITYPSGSKVSYGYDARDLLRTVDVNGKQIAIYNRDELGRTNALLYGDNTVAWYSWDDSTGNLNSLDYTDWEGSSKLYSWAATYNQVSLATNITQKYENAEFTNDNSYDARYRLTEQNTTKDNADTTKNSYTVDSVGNLTKTPQADQQYNVLGQLTSRNSSTSHTDYSYDAQGNRASKTENNTTTNYTWTKGNQLASVTLPAGKEVAYQYDDSNLLQEKKTTNNDVSSTEKYTWDVNASVPHLLEDGDNEYIYGASSVPLAQIDKTTNKVDYLLVDNQNSVIGVTDDAGKKLSAYRYDAYGNLVYNEKDADHSVTPFAYAGEYQDSDTGLYNLRARWYEPETGTFLSKDPANALTGEAYSYASGNPLYYTDPLGLFSWNDAAQFGYGALDSVTMGISTMAINAVKPGLINECNPAFFWGGVTADVAAFAVPGYGLAKAGVKIAGKIVKSAIKEAKPLSSVVKAISFKRLPSHVIWEGESPEIAAFTRDAWKDGAPKVLHYHKFPTPEKDKIRALKLKGLKTKKGYQRDEYPYASTLEGDVRNPNAPPNKARLVPTYENSQQSTDLGKLVRQLNDGDAFRVIIKPGIRPIDYPSGGWNKVMAAHFATKGIIR